jgi:uncharacterized protein
MEPVLVEPAPAPPRDPVWTGWDVLAIFAFSVATIFVVTLLVFVAVLSLPGNGHSKPQDLAGDARIIFTSQTFAYAVIGVFMYLLLRKRYACSPMDAVRWNWSGAQVRWPMFFLAGVVLAVAVMLAAPYLPIPRSLPMQKLFRDATSAWLLATFGVLIAPVMEELFYRGFLYPVVKRRLGILAAVVLTALPFAMMHGPQYDWAWAALLLVFFVGAVFGIVREWSGSVAATVVVHMAYNATLLFSLFVSTNGFRNLERLQH